MLHGSIEFIHDAPVVCHLKIRPIYQVYLYILVRNTLVVGIAVFGILNIHELALLIQQLIEILIRLLVHAASCKSIKIQLVNIILLYIADVFVLAVIHAMYHLR